MHANTPNTETSQIIRRGSFARVVYYDASLPDDLAAAIWTDPNSLIERGELLRFGPARRTVRLVWNSQPYVLKHYAEPTRRHALKQMVQPSRAYTTWRFTHRLVGAGIATPRPAACVENRWGPLRRDSYLMYPYVEGRTLRSYFVTKAKDSPAVRHRLWQQLQELWDKLRILNVSLGDANVRNFIISSDGELWLIDLDKSRFHRSAQTAAPHQERGWKQVLRSSAKAEALGIDDPDGVPTSGRHRPHAA
jgi:tRNA A-37 threonylcarbamoyl transferase component Bud32